uniref:Uncharacterized protein n=1 Tax=Triticum urartu TaxID=4572 RepID=A0A8R7QBD4_TRIUA
SISFPCRRTCTYQAAVSQLAVVVRSLYDLYASRTQAVANRRRRTPQAAAPQPHLSSARNLPHLAISSSADPPALCNSATCPRDLPFCL